MFLYSNATVEISCDWNSSRCRKSFHTNFTNSLMPQRYTPFRRFCWGWRGYIFAGTVWFCFIWVEIWSSCGNQGGLPPDLKDSISGFEDFRNYATLQPFGVGSSTSVCGHVTQSCLFLLVLFFVANTLLRPKQSCPVGRSVTTVFTLDTLKSLIYHDSPEMLTQAHHCFIVSRPHKLWVPSASLWYCTLRVFYLVLWKPVRAV